MMVWKEALVVLGRRPRLLDDSAFSNAGISNLLNAFFRDFDRIGLEGFL